MRILPATIRRPGRHGAHPAFTLMEMLVVVALVTLMATLALPSILALYNAGADKQAYNLIAAQLTAARARAIEESTFAGLHIQLADAREGGTTDLLRPDFENICFSGIILYDRRKRCFGVEGQPRRLPGSIAFGKICGDTVDGSDYSGDAGDLAKFTTFSVVFTPLGSAVRNIHGGKVFFDSRHPAFSDDRVDPNDLLITGSQRLWHVEDANDHFPVTAMTLFDVGDYLGASSATGYLNDSAQFLPLNIHTGQLLSRE